MNQLGFVSDIYLPQMLYALTVRSPVAKGRLKSVECAKLPEGYTLIRAWDIPGRNRLENTSMPILAQGDLSYIGEPVALLLGPDKNILEDCSRACKVIVEEGMPHFSVHDVSDTMIAASRDIRIGDPESAFAGAASVVNGEYITGIQEHWYAEPTGAVALLEQKDMLINSVGVTVSTATQWPFHVKRSVAQVLGLPEITVLVKPTTTGLHMDGRLWYPSLVSCHAALGAWITKKPVRLLLTRGEDFSFSPKRFGTEIHIASALVDTGKLAGVEIKAVVNIGAYEVNESEILDHIYLGCLGVYKTDNFRFSGSVVKTNIPPQGPFAGFGLAEGFFAMEQQISRIAESCGQDPAQWRKDNYFNNVKDTVSGARLIDTTMSMSDYCRKWAAYELLRRQRRQSMSQDSPKKQWAEKGESLRGIGLALGSQSCDFLGAGPDNHNYSIELILARDGSLEIKTSTVSFGSNYEHIWAGIASGILGVDRKKIRINNSDSPDSGPSTLSRNITVLTYLVEQACIDINNQRSKDPLPITVRKTAPRQKNIDLNNALNSNDFSRCGWASAVVEVVIDPVEFLPKIRGVWMGINGGKIISENDARRSLKASIVQSLGWAYREQLNYVKGAIPALQFETFDIPGPSEIPPISIDFILDSSEQPRGIGDLPFACVPAAYLQAVSQALDHHFQSIPLKSLDIWYALMMKRGGVL